MQQNDYSNLVWLINRKYKSRAAFCRDANISYKQFSNAVNGKGDLTAQTIEKAVNVLSIPVEEIGLYFFAPLKTCNNK